MTGLQALDQLSTSTDSRLRKFGAVILLLILSYWTYELMRSYSIGQSPWIFLDYLNLIFHEAGHWLWMPLGQFWSIAGGSLTQILIPIVFLIAFWRQKDLLGSGFSLFWIGNNLVNVSYYIGDSTYRILPLLGGDESIHDWQWLLVHLGWLDYDYVISVVVRVCGFGFLLFSIGCILLAILSMRPIKSGV